MLKSEDIMKVTIIIPNYNGKHFMEPWFKIFRSTNM